MSFLARIGAGASIGDDKLFGYFLTEPEVRLGFNADIGIGLTMGASVSWNYRMKTLVEIGREVYMDAASRVNGSISHLWQWGSWGNVFARWDVAHQENDESRISVGTNLYF